MRNVITEENINAMIADYHNGASFLDLSNKYNFKEQTIQTHFQKRGIYNPKINKRNFSKDELDKIVEDYNNGMRPYELGNKYNRTSTTIIYKLKSLGIYKCTNYRFTDEDIEFLKTYYPLGDWNMIFKRFPNMNKQQIFHKTSELNIRSIKYIDDTRWTDDELNILRNNYSHGNINNLLKLLPKRTYNSITTKARKMGLKSRDYWSENELNILKKYYTILEMDEILSLLPNRNKDTIYIKASELGLHREQNFYKDNEIEFIKNNALILSDEEISNVLNRSVKSIQMKRLELGFSKYDRPKKYNSLIEYIRKNIFKWKIDSIKNCGFKCILTGERFDCIHHIHGFNLIYEEMVNSSNLVIKDDISLYTNEELTNIVKCFNNIQNKYPLGVCLTKDLHILFHSIYGYGNNTEKQWSEFSYNYINGNIKM